MTEIRLIKIFRNLHLIYELVFDKMIIRSLINFYRIVL